MNDLRPAIHQSVPVDISKAYDPTTLSDKTVVITGGASGLGARLVRHWAALGAHITIGDVNDTAGEALVADLRAAHPASTFTYRHCDVTSWTDQVALFEEACRASARGSIDIVVPNAGVIGIGAETQYDVPAVDGPGPPRRPDLKTLEVNVTGVAYTAHLSLHYLPLNGARDRCLLLIGSLASIMPLPSQALYTTSKHAVLGLFRSLRAGPQACGEGLRVNMICPYYVSGTAMLPQAAEAVCLSGSAGAATAEDVLDAATRLVADEAIVGRALVVGPRVSQSPLPGKAGEGRLRPEELALGGRAVWECYAEDYDDADWFVWRYVRLLNAIGRARGYWAWVADVWRIWGRGR